ncbi:hypothetical protein DXG01_010152 [Tephrocybe rancida]|nr:hypothetical protein DXG01_010152 [Tephrocybe rancida]
MGPNLKCHKPPVTDKILIGIVQKHNEALKARKSNTDPVPWDWKCARCALVALSPEIQVLGPSEVIDLSISDSDDEKPVKPPKAEFVREAKESEDQRAQIDQDIKPAQSGQVKIEELPLNLPPRTPRQYNIAPVWIHNQHLESQSFDAWDRLAKKSLSRRPRKLTSQPGIRQPTDRAAFVFSAADWLESRRHTLPV